MRRLFLFILLSFILQAELAFNQIPDTDIWIVDLNDGDDSLIKKIQNITNRQGYDNQPFFTENGDLLFTSIRENDQADIFIYGQLSKSVSRISVSNESEYSPQRFKDDTLITCVRVEADSAQRLWLIGKNSANIIRPDIDSIGYYARINDNSFAAFILTSPFTLVSFEINNSRPPQLIAKDIGRSMTVRNQTLYYTVNKDSVLHIASYKNGKSELIIPALKDSQDFALLNNTNIIMAHGDKIYKLDLNKKSQGWQMIMDLSAYGIKNITRVAVNKNGTQLALAGSKNN